MYMMNNIAKFYCQHFLHSVLFNFFAVVFICFAFANEVKAAKANKLDSELYGLVEGNHSTKDMDDAITRGADINYRNGRILKKAIKNRLPHLVKYLLLRGGDPNVGRGRDSILYHAIKADLLSVTEDLLKAGADPNLSFSSSVRKTTNLEMLDLLLKYGADVNIPGTNGPALYEAIRLADFGKARWLVKAGADIFQLNKRKKTVLADAFSSVGNNYPLVSLKKFLDNMSIKPDQETLSSMLSTSLSLQRLRRVEFVLSLGVTVNPWHLKSAFGYPSTQSLKLLLNVAPKEAIDEAFAIACNIGSKSVVRLFLEKGANANSVSPNGRTALINAIRAKRYQLVSQLLDAGADINFQSVKGDTALMTAVIHKDTWIVDTLLLAPDIDLTLTNNDSSDALILAVKQKDVYIVQQLLKKGAPIKSSRTMQSLVNFSVRSGNVKFVKQLMESGLNFNTMTKEGSPLNLAIDRHDTQMIKFLLQNGVDPDLSVDGSQPPLIRAIKKNDEVIVKVLIEGKANVNIQYRGTSAAIIALTNRDVNITKMLLSHSAWSKDKYFDSVGLVRAIKLKDLDLIKLVLDKGVDPNLKGGTSLALFEAASTQDTDIVQLLLDRGANIKIRIRHDDHILTQNPYGLRYDMAAFLISRGADPDRMRLNRQTALHIAAKVGRPELVRLYIKHGARVNAKDDEGRSPAFIATRHGYPEILELLINDEIREEIKTEPFIFLNAAIRSRSWTTVKMILDLPMTFDQSFCSFTKSKQTKLHILVRLKKFFTLKGVDC